MSLWRRLKSLISIKNSATEEVIQKSIEELFLEACAIHGIGQKVIEQTEATEKFINWYQGPANLEDVKKSIPLFIKTDGKVSAKMGRFFR